MNIKLNYVSMQSGTMFSLLDLVDHSWTMGLNFGGMVLSQSQNLPLGLILPWEMGYQGRANIWW
jgi:hypothetical protein